MLKQYLAPLIDKVYSTCAATKIAQLRLYFVAILKMKMGIATPLRNEARRVLEYVILQYFAENNAFYRILFIGCDYYTWHYKRIMRGKEYWTVDPIVLKVLFGAKRHIVDYVQRIDHYFKENSLDLIVCNRNILSISNYI